MPGSSACTAVRLSPRTCDVTRCGLAWSSIPGEVVIRRVAVAAVVAVSIAVGVGGGATAWTAAERREAVGLREAAQARVERALGAVHDDSTARVAWTTTSDVAGAQALQTGARAALAAAVAQGRLTVEESVGGVGEDDTPRAALVARLDAAEVAAPTASPTLARRLTAEVVEAEQAVHAAVAAEAERVAAAEQAAARQAARAAAPAVRPRAAAATGGSSTGTDRCATTYGGPAFYTSAPTEGGDGSNGRLPASALSAVSWARDSRGTPFYLRSDATAALERLNVAFRAALGHHLALDLTYRDHDTQVAMRAALGSVAAVPGTSSHGTGLALDVPELPCTYGWDSPARAWLVANGPAYGWVSPTWARQNGSNPEYWHYEYRG
ncbi:M15 family metallopeptidase [Cellulomonas dongxiuzhuiae]|uniref:M15 family metallopeptidase n=1 Tax=Cellulomonas dongxiuzhuiae TaxID=2819979 RepID=A0ABX8GL24_9CELL|nr:M15 family metallopeptidase [Cellulomonas dongxiuzhuiae]QWC16638.1 M15 family metallopeptidase [Cellulomonas dongxiuzhuiae]